MAVLHNWEAERLASHLQKPVTAGARAVVGAAIPNRHAMLGAICKL